MYIHVAVKNKSKVVNFCTVYSTISNYSGGVTIYILQFSVTKIPINTLRQRKDKETYSHHCVHNTCTCNCTNHYFNSILPCEPSSLYHQLWLWQILQKGYSEGKNKVLSISNKAYLVIIRTQGFRCCVNSCTKSTYI